MTEGEAGDDGAPQLEGRTALVTGASRGIGRAVALALDDAGARVLPASRGGPALDAVADRCGERPLEADLTHDGDLAELAEDVRERLGGAPGLLVNNAGAFGLAPAHETGADLLDRHLELNLRAPVLLTRRFLPAMRGRGAGHLLHLGSVAGREALPGNAAYSASKYGLRGFHEVLRVELRGTGVCSTLIEPGPVDTGAWDGLEERLGDDLPPREAMLAPGDVAGAVLHAVSLGPFGRGGCPGHLSLEP